ncbi:MAG: hypothetical protein Q4G34_01055 [Micrococcus sp.]|nr:hypothetical protein [Micrococcus sp.]
MTEHDPTEAEAATLADAAERGELAPTGDARHGEQSRAETAAMLMAATDTSAIHDAVTVSLGRPRVGESRPETRQWRVRVPAALDDAAREVAQREGLTVSDVVRRAVAAQLAGGKP